MEDNKLTVKLNGVGDITINVLDIIDNPTDNKEYITYTIENNEQVYVSILEESENSYELKNIDNPEELQMVEEYIKEYTENGE